MPERVVGIVPVDTLHNVEDRLPPEQLDDALKQLETSLAIDPKHAQSLFNLGIVRRDGRKDAKGAVEAWTRLLEVAPDYPEAARVRTLIQETK